MSNNKYVLVLTKSTTFLNKLKKHFKELFHNFLFSESRRVGINLESTILKLLLSVKKTYSFFGSPLIYEFTFINAINKK